MADFLSRLADRSLGLADVIRPSIAPLFAPGPGLPEDDTVSPPLDPADHIAGGGRSLQALADLTVSLDESSQPAGSARADADVPLHPLPLVPARQEPVHVDDRQQTARAVRRPSLAPPEPTVR